MARKEKTTPVNFWVLSEALFVGYIIKSLLDLVKTISSELEILIRDSRPSTSCMPINSFIACQGLKRKCLNAFYFGIGTGTQPSALRQ